MMHGQRNIKLLNALPFAHQVTLFD